MPPPSDADVADAFRRYFPLLTQKCIRMLGDRDEAEDVAQECFAKLWNARLDIGDPRAMTAWLYRASTRLAIDRFRTRRRTVRESGAPPAPALASDPEDRAHFRALFERFATHLRARELEVAVLSRLDGLTHAEIAEVTGLGERSVRRALVDFDARLARWRERSDA